MAAEPYLLETGPRHIFDLHTRNLSNICVGFVRPWPSSEKNELFLSLSDILLLNSGRTVHFSTPGHLTTTTLDFCLFFPGSLRG
jgi:hypothetical protein